MKRTLITTLMGIFAIFAITTLADAQPGKQRGMMHSKIMSELNLTEAQKTKLQTLRTAHQKEMVKMQAAVKLAEIELRDVLRQDNPKTSDVKARIATVSEAKNKVAEARILNRLETKKVFTPEQLQKMETLKAQYGPGKGMRNGRGQGRFHQRGFRGQRGPSMMPGNFEMDMPEAAPEKM